MSFKFFFIFLYFLSCISIAQNSVTEFVNPMIGASTNTTKAHAYHGLGKTFPGATTPFGMTQVSPNTITGGDNGSGYSSEHISIEGFAMTQMSGVGWYGDLGNFLVMPTNGTLKTSAGFVHNTESGYRSYYDKDSELASPGYYRVKLSDYNILAEMTATTRCGMLRFTFPANPQSRIQIDLARRVGGTATKQFIEVVDNKTIKGWIQCTPEGGGWGNGMGKGEYTIFFYAEFSKPFVNSGTWSADIPKTWSRKLEDVTSSRYQKQIANAEIEYNVARKEGNHLGFFAEFSTTDQEQIILKTGISFVDVEGAEKNLSSEISHFDFDRIHQQAEAKWNDALSKIEVSGGTSRDKTIFYTALYHAQIDPRIFQDVDGRYVGGDHNPHLSENFIKRTIFSGWDVFRSQLPLQTIINSSIVNDLINSLITLADEKEIPYLPRWEFLNNYSGCMIGNPAVSVIVDAYRKGIRNYDLSRAYNLSLQSVQRYNNSDKGYTAGDMGISYTLEYSYNNWCFAQLAIALNKNKLADKYFQKSKDYRNVYDKEKGWFRPKDNLGKWLDWPKAGRLQQGYGSIESNPYQQGWFVPHDVQGMIKLMGGKEKVRRDLISFFEKTPIEMTWNNYYNHANEPVHHVPFLFNKLDAPWLTQKWTRFILEHAYSDNIEGLVGNEDVGQMSAWYVLAASGLHPVSPGSTKYEITSPLFKEINFNKRTNHPFKIIAKGNDKKHIYIQSAKLNGEAYTKCFIEYEQIISGGTLELEMGTEPNLSWGINLAE